MYIHLIDILKTTKFRVTHDVNRVNIYMNEYTNKNKN